MTPTRRGEPCPDRAQVLARRVKRPGVVAVLGGGCSMGAGRAGYSLCLSARS
jgi:hypothetical protein